MYAIFLIFNLKKQNNKTADLCHSSHPYCMTDYLSGKKKKNENTFEGTRESGNVTHLSGASAGKIKKNLDANFSFFLFFNKLSPHTDVSEVANNTERSLCLHTEPNK